MTSWKADFDRASKTLGFRLAFLLGIALLPLCMVSAIQSAAMLKETRARSEAALMGETMRAAEADLLLIQRARGAVAALTRLVVPVMGDIDACNAMMRNFVGTSGIYRSAVFIDRSGISHCSSSEDQLDISNDTEFQVALEEKRPLIRLASGIGAGNESVIIVADPVMQGDTVLGYMSLSLPHDALTSNRVSPRTTAHPPALLTYDATGNILTSSVDMEEITSVLPQNRSLTALSMANEDVSFTARTAEGRSRSFAVIPIVPDLLYAMGSWSAEGDDVWYLRMLPSLTLPFAMWLACLIVAFLAVERSVTRHVRVLRTAMSGFGDGKRIIGRMDMANAPTELRDLSETFEHMTDTILHDEAEMEDMIHQKEVLLREVHHRVKNNLQLIASIMNMQMRQARSAEAKSLMKGLQERVMSLATIHRELYQTSGLTDIRADELLVDISRQVVKLASGPGRQIGLGHSFADVRLTPDQAVPLSLLLTEALANAVKYAGAHEGKPRIEVALWREGGTQAVLEVSNTVGPNGQMSDAEGTGLGAQLLAAFAQQIGGKVDITHDDDKYTLSVAFEVRPLNEAEARISGDVTS